MKIEQVQPHQIGWLRRPELDQDHIEVWEQPDGKLYAHKKGTKLVLEVFRGFPDE